jgi:hypothetical protein
MMITVYLNLSIVLLCPPLTKKKVHSIGSQELLCRLRHVLSCRDTACIWDVM